MSNETYPKIPDIEQKWLGCYQPVVLALGMSTACAFAYSFYGPEWNASLNAYLLFMIGLMMFPLRQIRDCIRERCYQLCTLDARSDDNLTGMRRSDVASLEWIAIKSRVALSAFYWAWFYRGIGLSFFLAVTTPWVVALYISPLREDIYIATVTTALTCLMFNYFLWSTAYSLRHLDCNASA